MGKIKFWIALWGGKFFSFLFKCLKRNRDDRPGLLSLKIDADFLSKLSKPPLTICVSGSNGKTSISLLLADIFRKEGYKVANNDWGANLNAGHAYLMLNSVSIFNKSKVDVAVIETDEKISSFTVPQLNPNYYILNNLGRDSMFRNANPEFIAERIKKALLKSKDTTVIINADDPLCYEVGENNRTIYFGVNDIKSKESKKIIDDYIYCHNCYRTLKYKYKNYRHIGKFYCDNCGFKSHNIDYFVESYDDNTLKLNENGKEYSYYLFSNAVHNVYNSATIISILRDLNYSPEKINKLLSSVKITKSREDEKIVNGVKILTRASKAQCPTASSTIAESVKNISGNKVVIITYDEELDPGHFETIAWIYNTDIENYNDDSIKKIILAGDRYLDEKVRFKLGGIQEDKLIAIRDLDLVSDYVDVEGIDLVIIVHDIMVSRIAHEIQDKIANKIRNGEK